MSETCHQVKSESGGNCWLKWRDYENHISTLARQLLEDNCMVDVTLAVAGERIHAHRIVLCACSSLFQEILSEAKDDHPTVIITDISPEDLRSIVEFSYYGEIRIPTENIDNLLEAAQLLKIYGLMEIDGLDENDSIINIKELSEDSSDVINTDIQDCSDSEIIQSLDQDCETEIGEEESKELKNNNTTTKVSSEKKKRRREHSKRDYSEDMLEAAINDLKNGQSLIEASTKNGIPRSTLYMRAKILGIQLHASRNEYPAECMKGAISAVLKGSSLQNASELYRIPKTVLWRRIQKEGYQIIRSEMKRTYGSDKREAAVKALERGENLTKVSLEFKIPKTTLFRDKARLVDEGKLPGSCWKKRKTVNEEFKKSRLEEAVAACRAGNMSQAAAAIRYSIPKTTIWRRLQQENKKNDEEISPEKKQTKTKKKLTSDKEKCKKNEDFSMCEVSSDIPITYIDESEMSGIPQNSVIILTTEDVEGLDLEDGREIIVNTDSEQNYVSCSIAVDENSSSYTQAES